MSQTLASTARELFDETDFPKVWQRITAWPPDAFAFTSTVLARTGAYRQVVSPPEGYVWPRDMAWQRRVAEDAYAWRHQLPGPPHDVKLLVEAEAGLRRCWQEPLASLAHPRSQEAWDNCCAVLGLHALADQACFGLGVPGPQDVSPSQKSSLALEANLHLVDTGTLAKVSPEVMRVLPKLRTPQLGITLRSLSHHVGAHASDITPHWHPAPDVADDLDRRLNLLLLPWPLEVPASSFQPVEGRLSNMSTRRFGFFEFNPPPLGDPERVLHVLEDAVKRLGPVHGVVFPEACLDRAEADQVAQLLKQRGVQLMLSGVRGPEENVAQLRLLQRREALTYEQPKHHRWCVDASQIRQYGLESVLNPSRMWWEHIKLPPRELHVVAANEWLGICHLICEDLARQDPVTQLVRSVGPTLVVALLQDGPQLARRWSARYATVLADDPGSSVLSLSSLGMALRSRVPGAPPSRVVALWKDSRTGPVEIELPEGKTGIWLSLCAEQLVEYTADGRSDTGASARLVLAHHEAVG
ncbi:MAG: hypothetical protein AB2A00_20450 [Myxococcota bacterium]